MCCTEGRVIGLGLLLITCVASTATVFTVPEELVNSCAFVLKGDEAVGTGFLLGLQDSNSTFCYLVTAKHVMSQAVRTEEKTLSVRFNLKGSHEARTIAFATLGFDNRRWLEHKNPAVDVAVAPLPIYDKVKELNVAMILISGPTSDLLATSDWIEKYKVGPGDNAFTLGLVPYLYTSDRENLVLARFGTVSLLVHEEIPLPGGRQKAYFLDCAAFPGNSGGPAFVVVGRSEEGPLLLGSRVALLGVVAQFVPSPLRLTEVDVSEAKQKAIIPLENTGISKVVPVDYLVDILFSDDQKAFRESVLAFKTRRKEPQGLETQQRQSTAQDPNGG